MLNKIIDNRIIDLIKENFSIDNKNPFYIQKNREIILKLELFPKVKQDIISNINIFIEKIDNEISLIKEETSNFKNLLNLGKNKFILYGSNNSALNIFIDEIESFNNLKSISLQAIDLLSVISNLQNNDINSLTQKIINSGVQNPIVIIRNLDKLEENQVNYILNFLNGNKYIDKYLGLEINIDNMMFLFPINNFEKIKNNELIFLKDLSFNEKIELVKSKIINKINNELNAKFQMNNFQISNFISILINQNIDGVSLALKDYVNFLIKNKHNEYNEELLNIWDLNNEFKILNNLNEKINEPGIVNIIGVNKFYDRASISKIIVKKNNSNENKILMKNNEDMLLSINIAKEVALSYVKDRSLKNSSFIISIEDINSISSGNSAGISLVTAMISIMLNKTISNEILFTGAITLNGDIKAVGGLKLKLISCSNLNIKKVFIPLENKKEFLEIKDYLDKNIEFILVKNYSDIFNHLFKKEEEK